jgi:hypothetical protein
MRFGAENEEARAMRRGGFLGWFVANCAFSLAKVGCSGGWCEGHGFKSMWARGEVHRY